MRTDATGMTNVKVRTVRRVRLAVGVLVALVFAVLTPVLLLNGAAGLLVAASMFLALVAGIDATVSADDVLRQPALPAAASEHTLAA